MRSEKRRQLKTDQIVREINSLQNVVYNSFCLVSQQRVTKFYFTDSRFERKFHTKMSATC